MEGGGVEGMETESIITLAEHLKLEKKKKECKREKKVHRQIHLPLLQSISGQKKYTITRQEEAKINGPATSPLTSIHLHPIPPRFLPPPACPSHPIPLFLLYVCPPSYYPPPALTHVHTYYPPPQVLPLPHTHLVSARCSDVLFLLTVLQVH